jgi:hypothetical protein
MSAEEAKQLLKYHSFLDEDIYHPRMENGFLGMLRPFTGEIYEENYHEVIKTMKVLSSELRIGDKVDREVISALWGICHQTRTLALDPEGALQRNDLISKEQINTLQDWIDVISYSTMMILQGSYNSEYFELYDN